MFEALKALSGWRGQRFTREKAAQTLPFTGNAGKRPGGGKAGPVGHSLWSRWALLSISSIHAQPWQDPWPVARGPGEGRRCEEVEGTRPLVAHNNLHFHAL